MDPQTWERIANIFSTAVDLPEKDRSRYLDDACEGNQQLRAQVDTLLAQDEAAQGEGFLAGAPLNLKSQLAPPADPLLGATLGAFQIKRRIGKGGMGNVYLATRTQDYKQQVAIKMLRRGMDSEEFVRRFRTEIRVLAALSKHPHVAGLIDAGTTDDGLPYLVMEYVEGEHIDNYCNRRSLTIRQRLELFRDVCSAVRAAHQHAVIHRDLKPSNILVTSEGVVKLIDFGIAKLVAPELSGETATPTRTELRPLTPDYASPEQLRGDSITTATDVYSLGVVLYELLAGRRPFQLSNATIAEWSELLPQQEPSKPSMAVLDNSAKQIAARRGQLRGDLDNIVLTALRSEPQRRYATVEQLDNDIQRYLEGRTVSARPISTAERLWRTCRRNPVASSLLLAVMLASAFGLAYLTWLSQHLVRETAIEGARQQAEMLTAVQDFYSKTVADRAQKRMPVTHRYATEEGAIPVPATFTIDLGEYLRETSDTGMRARLYSDEPFLTRKETGGPQDDFESAAIAALKAVPDEPYYEFTNDDRGRDVLRFATARTMRASCVKCHNEHEDSPRDDWSVGDFRGVLEITRPLDRDIARTRAALRSSFVLLICVTLALTGLFLAVLFFVPRSMR